MLKTTAIIRFFMRQQLYRPLNTRSTRVLSVKCNCHLSKRWATSYSEMGQWKCPEVLQFRRAYCSSSDEALPSHSKVNLPALSPTMEVGAIMSWNKKEGDRLEEGDLLAEIETDKATMGLEAPEEGYLAKILVVAGTRDVPIGKLICIIVPEEDHIKAFKDFKDDGTAPVAAAVTPQKTETPPTPQPPPPPISQPPPIPSPTPTSEDRVYASPMARRLAEQRNLRLQGKKGTGLFGSITTTDLKGMMPSEERPAPFAAAIGAASPFIDTPVSSVRATIAKRLLQSKQTIPHYYLTVEMNVEKVVEVRRRLNERLGADGGIKLSLNDFVIKAVAVASRKVPEANSAWMETVIRQFSNVDVSVAVSTDRGLITPIIFGADRKGLIEISTDMRRLAEKAREGKLQPAEYQGGTISVSNLGMFGINHFCAIINPPQSCILAVGTTVQRLILDENVEKGVRECPMLTVTLSSDHRVVDGAVGAKWLQHFKQCMVDPTNMIL